MLVRQALWSFNQYEVLRALWKMVAVSGLTYANAVLCLSTGMREFLERRQREVGRMALGTHRQTPVEAIQGELGWSSFTAREAVAKAAYENRLLCLPEANLARQVLVYLSFSGRSTRWTRRTVKLRRVFDLPMVSLATAATAGSRKEVHERVQSAETRKWQEACQQKSSLAVYCREKTEIRREWLYDNSKGSGLLAEARCGVLRTRTWRARFTANLAKTCALCDSAEETTEHVVVACTWVQEAGGN